MATRIGEYAPVDEAKYMERRKERATRVLNVSKEVERVKCLLTVRTTLKRLGRLADDLYQSAPEGCSLGAEHEERLLAILRESRAHRDQYMDLIGVPKRPADRGPVNGKGRMSPVFDADLVNIEANGLPDGLSEPGPGVNQA